MDYSLFLSLMVTEESMEEEKKKKKKWTEKPNNFSKMISYSICPESRWIQSTDLRKDGVNVHSTTIYNSQEMKATQVLSTDDWIKKVWFTYTMEHHSAIKKKEYCHL